MPPRLQAFGAIVLWGLSFVATRVVLRELTPATLVFTRFAMGVALLFGVLALRGRLALPPRDAWWPLAGLGFLAVFVHQTIQSYALTLTTAIRTGWLIGVGPLWNAIIGVAFLRERLGPMAIAGLALGFAGALMIVTRGDVAGAGVALPATLGDLLILATTLNWSIYTAVSRGTIRRLGSLPTTAWAMALGLAMLAVPFALGAGWTEWPRLSGAGWGALCFLGFGCSGLGYLLWSGALEKLPSTQVASFLYIEPLVTLAAAVPVLGEPVTTLTLIGGVIVLAGVALVQKGAQPPATE